MGKLDAWEYLRGLKTVFVPEERREGNVRLMEPDPWCKMAAEIIGASRTP